MGPPLGGGIGPAAARPLRLDIPVFVSDMSFGALSARPAVRDGGDLAGRFPDWRTLDDARALVDGTRAVSGGIPIGVKMSAQHVEADLDAALSLGIDYVILDGRGGGTGAAPAIFRDNVSVPSMAALAVLAVISTGSAHPK